MVAIFTGTCSAGTRWNFLVDLAVVFALIAKYANMEQKAAGPQVEVSEMSVITASKSFEDLLRLVEKQEGLPVVVLGCDKCAKISRTGGTDEVRALRDLLRRAGVDLRCVGALVDAVEEGLCDPKAVAARLEPLSSEDHEFQLVVLSCGAGLKCVRDVLPDTPIIPGLDTLGPGVKGELACLACGRCEFGTAGCKMLQVAALQAQMLSDGYPER